MKKHIASAVALCSIYGSLFAHMEQQNPVYAASRCMECQDEVAEEEKIAIQTSSGISMIGKSPYFAPFIGINTTHLGALHYPKMVSFFGEQMTLEDGSLWDVRPENRHLIYSWLMSDSVVLTQNFSWLSPYLFAMKNLITNQEIEVNLAPLFIRTSLAYTIVQIDHILEQLCLSDGSVWELNGYKRATWGTWALGDMAIIGINGSAYWGYPNILIDAETNSYVEAKCIF